MCIELTFSGEEGDGSTHGTSTTGTADSVDVVLRVVGVVVVEDVGNVTNIFKVRVSMSVGRTVVYQKRAFVGRVI